MKTSSAKLAALFLALFLAAGLNGRSADSPSQTERNWIAFPDNTKFKVLGLAWSETNSPKLWRMPAPAMDSLPKGVQGRSKCPSGGRIVMRCTTSRLAVQAAAANGGDPRRFETYVNGQPCKSTVGDKTGDATELVLFQDLDHQEKEIVIYLPHLQEVLVKAIGVDPGTRFTTPDHRYARPQPVVFYGSSVCQGSGAINPGQTYPAILGRELNLDFVNLGFGGAGKAETNVVELVNSVPGCCYVFDLGKSYGMQDATAFKSMLAAIRRRHPSVPIIAMTPITSVKEVGDPSYSARSVHTRTVMRDPVNELIKAGDKQLFLVEGEDLIGFKEHDALSRDGVHPSDRGYGIIANKLAPVLKRALGL